MTFTGTQLRHLVYMEYILTMMPCRYRLIFLKLPLKSAWQQDRCHCKIEYVQHGTHKLETVSSKLRHRHANKQAKKHLQTEH